MRNYGIPLFFSKMALHGGGHLELIKMHKGDFWGIFGIRLGRCPCIIPEKISFLQFYSRFNPNALALLGQSDEPSDSRGSLSPTSVYSTWQSQAVTHPIMEPGATLLNFSDRANHERTPYCVCLPIFNYYSCFQL